MCAGSVPCETGMADVCSLVAPPHTHQMSSMWCTGIATPGSLLGNKQGIAKYSECADLCTCSVRGGFHKWAIILDYEQILLMQVLQD